MTRLQVPQALAHTASPAQSVLQDSVHPLPPGLFLGSPHPQPHQYSICISVECDGCIQCHHGQRHHTHLCKHGRLVLVSAGSHTESHSSEANQPFTRFRTQAQSKYTTVT